MLFGKKKIVKENFICNKALLDQYPDACIILNKETNEIVCVNNKFISLLNLPVESSLKDVNFITILFNHLSEKSENKELIMNGIPDVWEGEGSFITKQKVLIHTQIKANTFLNEDTNHQIIFIRDITAYKHAERELHIHKAQVQKAAKAKARFLSSMSHELRTPLNGIIGTSHLILTEKNLPENIKENVNVLKYSSEHMLGIINDILDFSKIDAGKLELRKHVFNLKNCVKNIIKSFDNQYRDKKIDFHLLCSQEFDDINIFSDEVKLSQVFKNLISNALKFTHEGAVSLEVSIKERTKKSATILFAVTDTGIGIPAEKLAEIFQGFVQVHADELSRRHGGTGLGLTISERLVDKFGGNLQVESELGVGSRFFFTLKFETAEATAPAIPENTFGQEVTGDTNGLKILVVEDNEINASILINFLHKWGVIIKEASNGIQALELIKYHQFDLVLMDLEMPEMDGYSAIKIIRETDRTTPVLAFTATLLENMESIISDTGFNDYILKPYRPAELKKKILQYAPHRKVDYA